MESILHEAQSKMLPFLSSIVGNDTIVTLMTAYHLAVGTLLDASTSGSGSFSYESASFPGQDYFDGDMYNHEQEQYPFDDPYGQAGFAGNAHPHHRGGRPVSLLRMVGMGMYYVFSFVHSMVSQILQAQLSSMPATSKISPSATSLASFVFTCLITLLLFRIAIGLVLSVFRSVLWLLQTAVFMSLAGVAIWVVYHMTSGFSSTPSKNGGGDDPSTETWRREYARQQKEYQKMFKNR
ncbi:hypothetical protein DFQ26_000307 [Actinomortierella ambigua]|nr:hypothetical protein DFQ26_000307 [Actinomortierella ambigua]